MRRILQLISWLALVGILAASCIFYCQGVEPARVTLWMLVFTVIWFVVTPLWMDRKAAE